MEMHVRATHSSGSPLANWQMTPTMPDIHVVRDIPAFSSLRCQMLIVLAVIALPSIAAAQDTRAGAIAAEQAEKATRLAPHVPTKAERLIDTAQRILIEQPSGFYPYFGSVYSGGGFTLGRRLPALHRRPHALERRRAVLRKELQAHRGERIASPGHAAGTIDVRARAGWRDATQVPFTVSASTARRTRRRHFRMQQAYAGGDVVVPSGHNGSCLRPARHTRTTRSRARRAT